MREGKKINGLIFYCYFLILVFLMVYILYLLWIINDGIISIIAIHRDVKLVTSSLVELNRDYSVLERRIADITNDRFILPKKYNGIINLLDIFKKFK